MAPEARQDSQEALASRGETQLSIVIVGYNSRDALGKCLPSIIEGGIETSFETIIIDNNSSDGTGEFIRSTFPWVRLIENAANVGYSRAVNQGIASSVGRYVLVLNPDILVLPGSVDKLVRFMDTHPDTGVSGSRLLNPDGTLQHSCRRFHTLWTLLLRRTFLGKIFRKSRAIASYLMLDYDHAVPREVDWLIGACMMVRMRALTDVGLMDERFFLYFEDVDWCYRMWRGGWKVFYVADSVMQHGLARESARPGFSKLLVTHVMSLFHFYDKWGRLAYTVKRFRLVILTIVLLVSDLIAINGSFALAYLMRSSLGGLLEKPMFGVRVYQPFLAFANLVFVFSFAFFGLYRGQSQRERGADLLFTVLRASFVSAIILMASTFLTYQTYYSRFLVGLFCLLVVVLVTCLRLLIRWFHRLVRAGRFDLVRIVVVGTGATAEHLAERIAAHADLGYDLAGLVATDHDESVVQSPRFPVVGTLAELPNLIERHRIGEVVFGEPRLSADEIADFLLKARRRGVDVRMVSGLTGILTQRARVEEFLETPVVTFEREALLGAGAAAKRTLDVVGATALLVLWSPILAALGFSGRTGHDGGMISRLTRAGLRGRTFSMFALAPTDRPSALRRFVGRHGLASYPALANVLKGEMSLVGPEPVSPEELEGYDSRERLRFDARPGITGLSQVARTGDAFSRKDATALDLYYIQNWSLGGDVRILLRWLGRCLAGRCGASGT